MQLYTAGLWTMLYDVSCLCFGTDKSFIAVILIAQYCTLIPKKSWKIKYKKNFTSLRVSTLRYLQFKHNAEIWHCILGPSITSRISDLPRSLFWCFAGLLYKTALILVWIILRQSVTQTLNGGKLHGWLIGTGLEESGHGLISTLASMPLEARKKTTKIYI